MFGDSITYGRSDVNGGWASRLRKFLDEKESSKPDQHYFKVYNLGIGENDTNNLLKRFEFELKQRVDEEMQKVIIFGIGTIDAKFVHSKNSLQTTHDMFKINIQKLFTVAQHFTSNIIFVGLTPVDEPKTTPTQWNTDNSIMNSNVSGHNKTLQLFCKQNKIQFVDLFDSWLAANYKLLLYEDGLHPNSEGHKKIFEAVKKVILKYI